MKDAIKSEIRRILLGYVAYDTNQCLIASDHSERLRLLGLFNGTGAAGALGVAVKKRRYFLNKELLPAEDTCRDAFARMGRRVSLSTEPELLAVFYSPLLYNPSILTAECSEERLEICVYTARTLTVRLNTEHAFRKWRQRMPEGLREKPLKEDEKRKTDEKRQNKHAKRMRGNMPGNTQSDDTSKT